MYQNMINCSNLRTCIIFVYRDIKNSTCLSYLLTPYKKNLLSSLKQYCNPKIVGSYKFVQAS